MDTWRDPCKQCESSAFMHCVTCEMQAVQGVPVRIKLKPREKLCDQPSGS